ncbi:MAG: hypothetical protein AAF958_11795 [Planctomycetota bacterium]
MSAAPDAAKPDSAPKPDSAAKKTVSHGPNPEQPMLLRWRNWDDLSPAWLLLRTLRAIASPSMWFLALLVVVVDGTLAGWALETSVRKDANQDVAWVSPRGDMIVLQDPAETRWRSRLDAEPVYSIHRSAWGGLAWWNDRLGVYRYLSLSNVATGVFLLWHLAGLLPWALFGLRQGARLTAGQTLGSLPDLCKEVLARWPAALVVVATVPLCAGLSWLLFAVFARIHFSWPVVGELWDLIKIFPLVPAIILAGGALVAVPMALAALINQPRADPLDALSRGYECVFRGWPSLCGLAIVVLLLWLMSLPISWAAAHVGVWLAAASESLGVGKEDLLGVYRIFALLPAAVSSIVWLTAAGGVYLVLRRVTSGQEVEELWDGIPRPTPELPTLAVDP